MSDADSLLRERLGAAAAFDVETDPGRVREDVARRQRRIRRRRRGVAVAGVLAVAAVAAGVVSLAGEDSGDDLAVQQQEAPSTASPDGADATGTFPHFDPAPGWEAVQVGSAATAADIALGPESAAGNVPWDTVERLQDGDVVLFAMSIPAREVSGGGFPPSELPLSLDAAQPGGLEGQPDDVYAERLLAEVDGWNIDLVAFYGALEPDAGTRAAAQEQLDRLVVPARAAPAAPGASRAAAGTCQPADLDAQVALADAGGGTLAGRITVRNVGASACTLAGPIGQVEPRDTSSTVIPSTTSEAEPAWSQAGEPAPTGWPAVELAPGSEAQAVLRIQNWCGAFQNRLYFVIRLPGQVDRISGVAPSVEVPPQCADPQAPLELAVGPFEPPRPTG